MNYQKFIGSYHNPDISGLPRTIEIVSINGNDVLARWHSSIWGRPTVTNMVGKIIAQPNDSNGYGAIYVSVSGVNEMQNPNGGNDPSSIKLAVSVTGYAENPDDPRNLIANISWSEDAPRFSHQNDVWKNKPFTRQ